MDSFPIFIIINTATATHPVPAGPFHIIFKSEKMPYLSTSWIQWSIYTFYKKPTSFPNKIQSLSWNITLKKALSNMVKRIGWQFQLFFSELPFTLTHSDF